MDASETILPTFLLSNCQVCSQEANGKRHYGAVVCRACAAFFRRAGCSKRVKTCKKKNTCAFLKDGFFTCKYCRLQKCLAVGMTAENFQFDRDGYSNDTQTVQIRNCIPPTMDTFCGRSNLIIFRAPPIPSARNFIDFQYLIDEVANVFKRGPATPLFSKTKLGKLALSLRKIEDTTPLPDPTKIKKFGRDISLGYIENNVLAVTEWLSHFDEIRNLPQKLQGSNADGNLECLVETGKSCSCCKKYQT